MNGVAPPRPLIKVEDKMDEEQLTRLATGVTVDSSTTAAAVNRSAFMLSLSD
jgi:16S rRNA U516 pseudouridylate synthase RsuA-like enzyme